MFDHYSQSQRYWLETLEDCLKYLVDSEFARYGSDRLDGDTGTDHL